MAATGEHVAMTLDAVILAVSAGRPRLLIVDGTDRGAALPSGPLDARRDTTLELGMRRLIRQQTGLEVGYIEQLYTFGDLDRSPPSGDGRLVSVAYVALVRETAPSATSRWVDAYDLFPWEDHRDRTQQQLLSALRASLDAWANGDEQRRQRIQLMFGAPWDGTRVLERYELLYEAQLVAEAEAGAEAGAGTDGAEALGQPLASDHRRIAATALGRIRGKLTYRPVVFELLPATFSLLELQRTVEALAGVQLHKQNFRRLVERSGLVEGTGERRAGTAGRPAELFRYRPSVQLERPRPGVGGIPYR